MQVFPSRTGFPIIVHRSGAPLGTTGDQGFPQRQLDSSHLQRSPRIHLSRSALFGISSSGSIPISFPPVPFPSIARSRRFKSAGNNGRRVGVQFSRSPLTGTSADCFFHHNDCRRRFARNPSSINHFKANLGRSSGRMILMYL